MKRKLLIVEDMNSLREALTKLAAKHNLDVTAADCFNKAKEKIKGNLFNGYMFDLNLPDGNGVDLALLAKSVTPNAKVIVFSGYVSKTDVKRLRDVGITDIFSKPIADIEKFEKAINSISK